MEAGDAFDVIILGFEPRDETPTSRLQRAFGIDTDAASRLVSGLPMTVQRAVSRVRAEYFRRALVLLGAEVEVRDPGGQLVESPEPVVANAPVEAAPPAPNQVLEQASPPTAPIAQAAWVDPMSRTFAQAAPAGQAAIVPPEPELLVAPPGSMPPIRVPANPTLREGTFPAIVIDEPAQVAPAAAPAAVQHAAPNPGEWRSLFGVAGGMQAIPRDPSGVWDPLPGATPPRHGLALDLAPALDLGPASPASPPVARAFDLAAPAPPPRAEQPATAVSIDLALPPDPIGKAAPSPKLPAHFDLTRSVVAGGLWRPPAPAAASPAAAGSAITLDPDKGDGARRVLSPWELPNADSMAEPKAVPVSRRPPGAARPGAAGPAPQASGRPATAAVVSARPGVEPAKRPAPAQRPPKVEARDASAALRPAAVGVPTRGAQRSLANADLRSFWETIADALILPFTGTGIYWLGAITAWSVFVGALAFVSHFAAIAGTLLMFCAYTSLTAFACDFYRVCLWTPATGEKAPDVAPSFDPVRLLDRYIKSGLHLSMFALASQVPLIGWVVHEVLDKVPPLEIATDPITWALLLVPYCYWPMGVGVAALSNNFAAIWNVPAGIRTIVRAPLEYATIVAIGVSVFVGTWVGLLLFGRLFGVTGALIAGTAGFPLALSHGIQGALMGHLVRARAEAFE